MVSEFDLISKYFFKATADRSDVALGIGDDCALLDIPEGMQLAVSMDTLVSGRHFTPDVDPRSLGHKSLAVNLSDLAAMGAEPAWVTLGLSLPEADEVWLSAFMQGFAALASEHNVQLVGGDTTRGPLCITVQVHGFIPRGKALTRAGAKPGDLIYVSGNLGDAGLALQSNLGNIVVDDNYLADIQRQLDWPQPQLVLGRLIRDYATSAIDLSDGLASDLGHICKASGVGASIHTEYLPLSIAVQTQVDKDQDYSLPLSAGDDYQLAFTLAESSQDEFETLAAKRGFEVANIGLIEQGKGIRLIMPDGSETNEISKGYDHFQ